MNSEKIGKLLTTLRGEKALRDIAAELGLSPAAIRQYESGNRIPRDDIKEKIAKLYNKTVQEIFYSE
ncbi:helix-turn-helix transcriptional regulator [Acetobacterium wieringae]|uniref:Helix-turn-helix transcriptional regulator n=1 Tax=Acetobacterium wieringae TaxID=52694 RepID=A0A5D0WQK4_9FIRM|nr:helix-turn-helix transcriptional regulator [Acetobacterium wieringae]TYC86384.1 helix-turn-helix transcriptional regulator [Acetobacterium wieringae]